MVRTDSKEQKLDAFVVPKSLQLTTAPIATSSSSLSVSHIKSVDTSQRKEGEEQQRVRQDRECVDREGGKEVGMEGVERGEGLGEEEMEVTGHQGVALEDRDVPCCSGSMEDTEGVGGSTAMDSSSSSTTSSATRPTIGG